MNYFPWLIKELISIPFPMKINTIIFILLFIAIGNTNGLAEKYIPKADKTTGNDIPSSS